MALAGVTRDKLPPYEPPTDGDKAALRAYNKAYNAKVNAVGSVGHTATDDTPSPSLAPRINAAIKKRRGG